MASRRASTPPYDKSVEFKTVISGTDVQHQISDLQSMIAAGANAIIMYPLSPTALNRVIKQACAKNILVFTYDSTVTEPCAYNVSNIRLATEPTWRNGWPTRWAARVRL
jgi:ribose transport system substrate-binding protein